MGKAITIKNRRISTSDPPYVIAEMSANHNGQLSNSLKIIDQAKKCGADAIKIQTYKPDTITLRSFNDEFLIKEGLWKGYTLYDLYQEAHTPWEWHKELFDYAAKKEITLFSSPFDNTAVDLLEDLNCPAYKIASFEIIDLPLIRYAASTGKPIIISTGMASKDEISEAIQTAIEAGCQQLAILLCVSGYPASSKDYNLRTISDMTKEFQVVVGLSDHTLSNITALSSISLGASLIEKHFTIDKKSGGPDDSFSLEPKEFKSLCTDCREAWEALGKVNYGIKDAEKQNLKFRRSLYFVKNLKKGEKIDEKSIKSVRPGFGISPKYYDEIIGKRLKVNVQSQTPVKLNYFEN